MIAELDQINPDVLIIDPLINVMGGVDVNNNSAAAVLIGRFAALAAKRRIAVMIAHHAAKGRDPASAETAMGAATFVNLCSIVLGIEPLDRRTRRGSGCRRGKPILCFGLSVQSKITVRRTKATGVSALKR